MSKRFAIVPFTFIVALGWVNTTRAENAPTNEVSKAEFFPKKLDSLNNNRNTYE
jgi:hypothetical protein